MKKRGSKWLFVSGVVGALTISTALRRAGAQPAAPPPAVPPPTSTSDAATPTAPLPTAAAPSQPAAATRATHSVVHTPSSPPPTPEQVAAYEALKAQADTFERGAKGYRDVVTTIIRLHYETKKKELLSGFEREISTEKESLKQARERAIKRLEEFVATYTGDRAQVEATPDAMYRLAALYEERARSDEASDDVSAGLKPAIALYKRIIREFPDYRAIAGIYYFLGHAYNDSSRIDEAQQVWRSLVCHNRYPYPTPPSAKDPDVDTILPLPQDNSPVYWTGWRHRHGDLRTIRPGDADATFVDPYPNDCKFISQPTLRAGEDPQYFGEVWWQIGNWEFDQFDIGGGVAADEPAAVYDFNRAASAYVHAKQYKKPPVYGVASYKYGWTLYKQQRYEAATKEFVNLLLYTDEQQKLTGDPGADFRGEAYTYIAGSLLNVNFTGPGPQDPFIQTPDIIDTEPRPEVVEQKLHVAVDRVKDPKIIPQDKPWTIEVYKALAQEFRGYSQNSNAIEVYDAILKKWPMDPSAPEIQNEIALAYEDLIRLKYKVGTPEAEAIASKALEARTALANYIGAAPWVDANKDNPTALQTAERLVKGGLRAAAVQHTNNGRQALAIAGDTSDSARAIDLLSRADSEFRLAAVGWAGFIKQDETAPDAYESRYWLADALHNAVRIKVVLHKLQPDKSAPPSLKDVDNAKAAAIDVRDSNEDDKYLANAAFFVVDEADANRDVDFARYDETNGASGSEQRKELKFDSDGPDRKVVIAPVPASVLASIQARDEFIQRVPAALDASHNASAYEFYAGEMFFLYGHFDDARKRLEPMYREHCGKDDYGYLAWEKLITMSNVTRDVDASRKLAEAEKEHSCAISGDQKAKRDLIVNPTLQEAAYVRAREKFKQAQNAQPAGGPEANKLWRDAAALYEAALSAAPGRDDAPEAAMNAAYAYKQVGEFNKAIDMYGKFINEYGSDARLSALEKGDAKAKVLPDPKKYKERVDYLGQAYDNLSTTYYSFFNYQRAAETYDKVASNPRFDEAKRKVSAKNAMVLYANMAQRDRMVAQSTIYMSLHPTVDEKANAEYLVADYEYKQWNPQGGDAGSNHSVRLSAESALSAFYAKNKANSAASKFVVEAAYQIAKMKKAAGDSAYHLWLKNTIAAWEFLRGHGATKDGKNDSQLPPYADYGAEAEFTLLDEEIREKFDYETGHHRYVGTIPDVLGTYDPKTGKQTKAGRYQKDAEDAEKYDKALEHIARTYPSVEWVPAAIARQGSLYDSLRTALFNTVPPSLKFFTPEQERLLKKLEDSGRDELQDQADDLRTQVKEGWRKKKELELTSSDMIMVKRYATAVVLARKYNVRNAAVQRAIARLAYMTDVVGDAKMGEYVGTTADPTSPEPDPNQRPKLQYKEGQFVQSRPGLTAMPAISGEGLPLPAAP